MKSKTRVLILADLDPGALDDESLGRGRRVAATWLPQIARAFEGKSDFDITWLTQARGPRSTKEVECFGQRFIEVRGVPFQADVASGLRLSAMALRPLIRRLASDVVHCWGTERPWAGVAGRAGLPTILSMQGILTALRRRGCLPEGWLWKRLAALEQGHLRRADVVTCESEWGIGVLNDLVPGKPLRRIEYGVHPSFYQVSWNPDPDDPFVLFCGSLTRSKGVQLLVEAAALSGGRRWRCEIAGDGPLREELQQQAGPGVTLLGSLDWPQLQQRLSRAWGLVLPTFADTSPNVVKEARVVGLPVVTTPEGGQTAYVRDGRSGFLVDPGNPRALREAIDRLVRDYNAMRDMGRHRHAEDREALRTERTAEAFLALYGELAARAAKRGGR